MSVRPAKTVQLIRVFAVHMKKAWVLSYSLSAQWRLWSDWADAIVIGYLSTGISKTIILLPLALVCHIFLNTFYEILETVWMALFIWAGPWENVSYVICEQQRRRSACASAQSDQRLCCSLLIWYNISRFYSRNFKTLGSFCRPGLCPAWSENPEDTFSRDAAHLFS